MSAPQKIVIVYPYKFTDNYYRKYEVEFLRQHCNVVVWDIGYFLYPQFTHVLSAKSSAQDCVCKIASWLDLGKALVQLGKQRVLFLQFSPATSFRALLCNMLIKLRGKTVLDFYNGGIPFPETHKERPASQIPKSKMLGYVANVCDLLRQGQYTKTFRMLWSRFVQLLSSVLALRPTHTLVAGKVWDEKYRKVAERKGIQVLPGLSWDLSNSLSYDRNVPNRLEPYGVLLDGAGPAFASDQELQGGKPFFTSECWYPALVNLFEQLERETGVKMVIAGHPLSKFPSHPKEFGESTGILWLHRRVGKKCRVCCHAF